MCQSQWQICKEFIPVSYLWTVAFSQYGLNQAQKQLKRLEKFREGMPPSLPDLLLHHEHKLHMYAMEGNRHIPQKLIFVRGNYSDEVHF